MTLPALPGLHVGRLAVARSARDFVHERLKRRPKACMI